MLKQSLLIKHRVPENRVRAVAEKPSIDFNREEEFEVVAQILQKDRQSRLHIESEIIVKAFSQFQFFKGLEAEMGAEEISTLYKELNLVQMKRRETVFSLGDIAQNFYIILRGSVWILIQRYGLAGDKRRGTHRLGFRPGFSQKTPVGLESLVKNLVNHHLQHAEHHHHPHNHTHNHRPDSISQSSEEEQDEYYYDLNDQEFLNLKFPDLKQVGTMESGQSFGEIALTKHMPRTATIVCKEDTCFVTLSRDKFNSFLSEYYYSIQQKTVKFLSKVKIFAGWTDTLLNQLSYNFTSKEFKMNNIVFKEGQAVDFVYIIFHGDFEISKTHQYQNYRMNQTEESISSFNRLVKQNFMKTVRQRIAVLGEGQVFGQEDILSQTFIRSSMAVCVSETAKVFMLDKDVCFSKNQRFRDYCMSGVSLEQVERIFKNQKQVRNDKSSYLLNIKKPEVLQIRKVRSNNMDEAIQQEKRCNRILTEYLSQNPKNNQVFTNQSLSSRHKTETNVSPRNFQYQSISAMHPTQKDSISPKNRAKKAISLQKSESSTVRQIVESVDQNFSRTRAEKMSFIMNQKLDLENPYFPTMNENQSQMFKVMIQKKYGKVKPQSVSQNFTTTHKNDGTNIEYQLGHQLRTPRNLHKAFGLLKIVDSASNRTPQRKQQVIKSSQHLSFLD